MAWTGDDFRAGYRRLAPIYDYGMPLYRLIGLRMDQYRQETISNLDLQAGETVVDLGCGTGLNLAGLVDGVGPSGRVIGVDLSPEMLEKARRKVERQGWANVELVESDMATFSFPKHVDKVIATLALATVDDYDTVVERVVDSLKPGGRLANFEMTWPETWPGWLVSLGAKLQTPFGVTTDLQHRKPQQSIRTRLQQVHYDERYFGAIYLSTGLKLVRDGEKP